MTLAEKRTSHTDFTGATFGDFHVVRPIASDSKTTLYLAQRTSGRGFVQPIALGVVHPGLVRQREFATTLLEGSRAAAAVHHPNVCRLFEYGEAQGTVYLAYQWLFGETLAEVVKTQRRSALPPLEPELIAHVIAQAADGLYAAHMATDARGVPLRILHGHLAPTLIHVGYDGHTSLLELGMSRARDHLHTGERDLLQERFAYLAPEQIRDEEPDARADIWALGVILRECLAGERLFRGSSAAQIIHAVLNEPLPPWPEHVPPALREIADRALRRDARDRYPNASAMASDLRLVYAGTEQQVETHLARWLRTAFHERMDEKQALLRQAAEDHRLRSASTPPPTDVTDTEEPTRAFFGEESLALQIVHEPAVSAEPTGSRSRVRVIEAVRSTFGKSDQTRSLRDALEALDARLRQQPFLFGILMMMLGLAVGVLITYATMAPPNALR